ncbi:MAG TPA: DUF192 domain-containing protein [Candidatus Paceibacterota bacterium]|nr:DUF192 domain-containing protein [Candidatus Paceibacterota bacterium]
MTTRIRYALYIAVAIGALLGGLLLSFRSRRDRVQPQPPTTHQSIVITPTRELPVSVADTPALREQGLSYTASLAAGTGKLFLFDTLGTPGFWMKGMEYSLDIVWIRDDWTVAAITPSLSPDTYPTIVYPPYLIQYVLEINAGEAAKDGIVAGAQLKFEP